MTPKAIIYNGYTLTQILNNLPLNMCKMHKKMYISNCFFVFDNEKAGYNLEYCKLTRNANFNLIKYYLKNA
jgi:uncharacterized protein YhbP (UPF0306 family)